jgi:hypothetical protein
MNLFVKIHEKENTGKATVAMIFSRSFGESDYYLGFGIPILEHLSEKFHLIVITGEKGDITHFKKHAEVWAVSAKGLAYLKDTRFKRADEMQEETDKNWKYNQKIVYEELEKSFGTNLFSNLHSIYIIDLIDFVLPLTSYVSKKENVHLHDMQSEFHDNTNPSKEELELIKKHTKRIADNYYYCCSVLAFSSHFKNISMSFIDWAVKQSSNFHMSYGFIIDPQFFTPIFHEWNIPFTAFYFVNDNRGTRNFVEFPMAELQHLVWDKRKTSKNLLDINVVEKKDRDFFFAGTIFQERGKGSRVELYNRYLKNLNIPNSYLYIPQKANGMINTHKTDRYIKKLNERFSETYEHVMNHPMYKGQLLGHEHSQEIKRYRYGLILHCVSYYDSLNFRPLLYADLRILPLLDPEYDPLGLLIPLDIQKHLIVLNADDIAKKVEFFNNNPELREELLDKLEYKFKTRTFKNNHKQILSNIFNF